MGRWKPPLDAEKSGYIMFCWEERWPALCPYEPALQFIVSGFNADTDGREWTQSLKVN